MGSWIVSHRRLRWKPSSSRPPSPQLLLSSVYSTRTVPLRLIYILNFHECVGRCRLILVELNASPATAVEVFCWSICPPSEHDCGLPYVSSLPSLHTSAVRARVEPPATPPLAVAVGALHLPRTSMATAGFTLSARRTSTPSNSNQRLRGVRRTGNFIGCVTPVRMARK